MIGTDKIKRTRTTFKSFFLVVARSLLKAISRKSISHWRSWTSSTTTWVTPFRLGSSWSLLRTTPVVQNRSLVCFDFFASIRMWYPTCLPTMSSISSATRSATDKAEILLGCVHKILALSPNPDRRASSKRYWGHCVVFPAPTVKRETSTFYIWWS